MQDVQRILCTLKLMDVADHSAMEECVSQKSLEPTTERYTLALRKD